jgi:hypothetical protein
MVSKKPTNNGKGVSNGSSATRIARDGPKAPLEATRQKPHDVSPALTVAGAPRGRLINLERRARFNRSGDGAA